MKIRPISRTFEQFVNKFYAFMENSTYFKDILNNLNKFYAFKCIMANSTYFKDITVVQSEFFFP